MTVCMCVCQSRLYGKKGKISSMNALCQIFNISFGHFSLSGAEYNVKREHNSVLVEWLNIRILV